MEQLTRTNGVAGSRTSDSLRLKHSALSGVIFGSGSTHAAHAQLMLQSAVDNGGKKIGLARGATSRMASWFYSMLRMLRLRNTLEAAIAQKKFRGLALNLKQRLAVADILNLLFWKAVFTLLRAVFPALRCLRYCDTNTPAMELKASLKARKTFRRHVF